MSKGKDVSPEDAKRLQEMIDSKNHTGVNLTLDVHTRTLTWGCGFCGSAPVLLSKQCSGGGFFPGFRCKKNEDRDDFV